MCNLRLLGPLAEFLGDVLLKFTEFPEQASVNGVLHPRADLGFLHPTHQHAGSTARCLGSHVICPLFDNLCKQLMALGETIDAVLLDLYSLTFDLGQMLFNRRLDSNILQQPWALLRRMCIPCNPGSLGRIAVRLTEVCRDEHCLLWREFCQC